MTPGQLSRLVTSTSSISLVTREGITVTVSSGDMRTTLSVSVTESTPPLAQQATFATSLIFLLVALLGIGARVFTFVKDREVRRELDEMHRRGGEAG